MRRVLLAHAWREGVPMVAFQHPLFAWMLLLTLMCQSVLPCGCARCEVGTASSAECSNSVCGGPHCSHVDGSTACDKAESVPRDGLLSHQSQSPGPAPCEVPCRRHTVFALINGVGNQASPNYAPDFEWAIPCHQSTGRRFSPLLMVVEIDASSGGMSRMVRSVRLQV